LASRANKFIYLRAGNEKLFVVCQRQTEKVSCSCKERFLPRGQEKTNTSHQRRIGWFFAYPLTFSFEYYTIHSENKKRVCPFRRAEKLIFTLIINTPLKGDKKT
jgi:hypothetical protein